MENIALYRKRFIPQETIFLKDDVIEQINEDLIVTSWKTLKPRNDFFKGVSFYYLKKGYKISKFMDKDGNLVYYYCDIIDISYNKEKNSYVFADLLVDVIVYQNGMVKVVDVEELADALDQKLIDEALVKKALRQLSSLLNVIYEKGITHLLEEGDGK